MYTKEQASRLRQSFWITFGKYMSPVPSAEGLKTNWINYKTGVKDINFKMNADKKKASVGIYLTHPDPGAQETAFEQFKANKSVLEAELGEEWQWEFQVQDEHGKTISRIYTELQSVNIFSQDDWPAVISFLKPRIMKLDEFWSMAKYQFM